MTAFDHMAKERLNEEVKFQQMPEKSQQSGLGRDSYIRELLVGGSMTGSAACAVGAKSTPRQNEPIFLFLIN